MDIKPSIYLEDTFQVIDIDKDGKYFEKVTRINAKSDIYEFELQLDINSDVYYMEEKQVKFLLLFQEINSYIVLHDCSCLLLKKRRNR